MGTDFFSNSGGEGGHNYKEKNWIPKNFRKKISETGQSAFFGSKWGTIFHTEGGWEPVIL